MKKLITIFLTLMSFYGYAQHNYGELNEKAHEKANVGDYQGAIVDINNAYEIAPTEADSFYCLSAMGQWKYENKDYIDAIKHLDLAIKMSPEYIPNFVWRGLANYNLGNYEKAMQDYNYFIDNGKEDYTIYFLRGNLKETLEDYKGAILDYGKGLKFDLDGEVHLRIGICKFKLHDYKDAIVDFDSVIELNPKTSQAFYYRGLSKITVDEIEGACYDLSKAGELGYFDAYDIIKKHCNN